MKKRLLAGIISLCMVVSLIPTSVFAAEPETKKVCAEGCTLEADHDGECELPKDCESGCTLEEGHDGDCVLPKECDPACTLEEGHDGECVLPKECEPDCTLEEGHEGDYVLPTKCIEEGCILDFKHTGEQEFAKAPVVDEGKVKTVVASSELYTYDEEGYFDTELPQGPDMTQDVINVNAANAQYTLDGAYGSINGKTIHFTESVDDVLVIGRPNKYVGSNTKYYRAGFGTEERTLEFIIENNGKYVDENYSHYYTRDVDSVTFTAEENVTLAGVSGCAGAHVYGAGAIDYVREVTMPESGGSCYFFADKLSNFTFEGISFTGKVDINTSLENAFITNFRFKNCTFEIGSTEANNQAIRYYNENNNGNVNNIIVDKCKFDTVFQGVYTGNVNGITITNSQFVTTGHNAIAVQDQGNCNHGNVVIVGNIFKNIGDRIIRIGNAASGTSFTIANNTATDSGDSDGEVMKANSLAEDLTYDIHDNSWGEGKKVANEELKDVIYVAEVAGFKYKTLQEAINGDVNGKTIKLLENITPDEIVKVDGKNLIIDLAGHSISREIAKTAASSYGTASSQPVIWAGNGTNLIIVDTVGGGKVEATNLGAAINIGKNSGGSKEDAATTVTLKAGTFNGGYAGSYVFYNGKLVVDGATVNNFVSLSKAGSSLEMKSGSIATEGVAITGNGTTGNGPTSVVISGGTVSSSNGPAIYHPQAGTLTVTGGTITGKDSAIAIKAGILTISGGELIATGEDTTPTEGYSNGVDASGAVIQIESNRSYAGSPEYKDSATYASPIQVCITGGTLTSQNGVTVYEYVATNVSGQVDTTKTSVSLMSITGGKFTSGTGKNIFLFSEQLSNSDVAKKFISGGTFSSDVQSDYLKIGYETKKNFNYYEVGKHDLQKVAGTAATCGSKGVAAHYKCTFCGKLYSDAAGNTEVTAASLVIPATGNHNYGAWQVSSQPTCTTAGSNKSVCSVCGHERYSPIAATGHSYGSDGRCTACGDYDATKVVTTPPAASTTTPTTPTTPAPAKPATTPETAETTPAPVENAKPETADTTITKVEASEEVIEAVKETVKVEEGTAKVETETIEKVIEATEEGKEVVLPLTQVTEEAVNKAEVSADALEKVAEKEADVVIQLTDVTVKLDAVAIAAVAEQAQGKNIEIRAVKTETVTLTEKQQDALADKETAIVVTAQIFADGEYIGDFKGGTATIMLPFTPEEGRAAEDYKVYFVDDDGSLTPVAAEYVDGHMVFTTGHFSDYAIVYEKAEAVEDSESDTEVVITPEEASEGTSLPIIPIVVVIAIIVIGGIVLVMRRKKEE